MSWQLTYHVLPQLGAVAVSLGLAVLIWRNRNASGSISLLFTLVGVVGWSTSYAIQIASADLGAKLVWHEARTLFVLLSVLGYFAFAAEYTSNDRWLRQPRLSVIVVPATVTVAMAFTNDAHGLMWADATVVGVSDGSNILSLDRGPWFWAHLVFVYLLMAGAIAWIARFARRNWTIYRGQAIVITVAGVVPWGLSGLFVLEYTTVDYSAFGLSISAGAFAWAMYRYDLLDLVPIARERVVEEMRDGVLVLDVHDRIVDLNEAALPVLAADRRVDALGATAHEELTATPPPGRARGRRPSTDPADGGGGRRPDGGATGEHADWADFGAPAGRDALATSVSGIGAVVDDEFETVVDTPLADLFDRDPLGRYAAEVTCWLDGRRRHYVLLLSPLRDDVDGFNGRLVVVQDVTAITRRERELEAITSQLEERTRQLEMRNREQSTLIENLPGVVYRCTDAESGAVTFVSDGASALTGFDAAAFESGDVSIRSITYPEDDERVTNRKRMAVENGDRFDLTYRIVTNDETQRWVRDIGKGIYDDGTLEFVEGFVLDVTENKQREQLQVLNRVLRHNIRNEMNVISGRLDLALQEADESVTGHLEVVDRASERVTRLGRKAREIQGLLDADGPPEIERVDLVAIIDRAVVKLSDEHAGEMTVEVTVPDRLAVYGNELLETALYELLENAVVHADEECPRVRVDARRIDDRAEVRIEDDGPGVPDSELEALTDGIESPLVHGSGLGLWAVRWIVDAYGDLDIASDDDGTTASVRLRRVADDRRTAAPTEG